MTGNIFSIEEFSTFDGPGIRCTVFLKGCPLCCSWCHNPEGQLFSPQILRAQSGCINCGRCQNTGLSEASIPLCPEHLYRICGQQFEATELIERLDDKINMLNLSGGGITFSGGEPLFQADFLNECLTLLHGRTHRAIQTSGYAEPAIFKKVIANTDYVLYDLKLMNNEDHLRHTGVSNKNILHNYRELANSSVPFITRIPLIPTVNDTEKNITETAKFMSSLGMNVVELLPYNRAAGAKYKSIGRTYTPNFDDTIAPQPHRKIFNDYGIEVKIL